jgi:hypothetical protein
MTTKLHNKFTYFEPMDRRQFHLSPQPKEESREDQPKVLPAWETSNVLLYKAVKDLT